MYKAPANRLNTLTAYAFYKSMTFRSHRHDESRRAVWFRSNELSVERRVCGVISITVPRFSSRGADELGRARVGARSHSCWKQSGLPHSGEAGCETPGGGRSRRSHLARSRIRRSPNLPIVKKPSATSAALPEAS